MQTIFDTTRPRRGARALLLGGAVALALAGCRDKDETKATAEIGDVKIERLSDRDMDAYFDVDARDVSDADGEAGLAALGLLEANDTVSWGDREGSGGDYTFSDLTLTSEDGAVLAIDSLRLQGVRETGGVAALDLMVADDAVLTPPEAEGALRIERMRLVDPDLTDVEAFLSGDSGVELPSARAFSVSGVSGELDDEDTEGTIAVKSLAFAKPRTATSADGFMVLDDVDIRVTDSESGNPVPIRITADDVMIGGVADAAIFDGDFDGLMKGSMMPTGEELPYRSMLVEDVEFAVDTMVFDISAIRASADVDGDRIVSRSRVEPMRFAFTGAPTDPELMPLYSGMQQVGIEEVVITAGGATVVDFAADTMVAEANYLDLQDLMRMEIDMEMGGVKAVREAHAAARAELGEVPGPGASPEELLDYEMKVAQSGLAGMDQLTVDRFRVGIDDNSIMDKIFEQIAAQQGTTSKALRMQTKGMLAMGTMMAGETGVDPEIVSELITAVGEFIDNPGSELVLTVDPATPTLVTGLQGMDKAAMGFSATVEK